MSFPLTLKVFQGDQLVATHDFDRDVIKIGRLSSAHLRLDDERVARIHTVLEVAPDGGLSVTDMGSIEGTLLNGRRVERSPVQLGDIVQIATTTIHIHRATELAAARLSDAVVRADQRPTVETAAVVPASLAKGLALAAQSDVTAKPVPQVRPPVAEKHGPLGAAVHFLWGRQRVGEMFLAPAARNAITVGTAAGVSFVLDEPKLRTPSFPLVRAEHGGFSVRLMAGMRGQLTRGEERITLDALMASPFVSREDDASVLALGKHDRLSLELGGVNVEVSLEPVPAPAWMPWQQTVNFAALNIFLVLFFLALLFIVSAVNRDAEGLRWADELNADARQVKFMIEAARKPKSAWLAGLTAQRARTAASSAPARGEAGKIGRPNAPTHGGASGAKPDPRQRALALLERVMPGGNRPAGGLFTDSLGGELRRALADVRNNGVGDTAGTGGLTLAGHGTGGGGHGTTVGLEGSITRMGGDPRGSRVGAGFMLGKDRTTPSIESDKIEIRGSIDPELIRRVIHSHRDQIRYCYEEQLNRAPRLAGKVKVRFVIRESGAVVTSDVAESSVGNAGLESCVAQRVRTWIFPSIRDGGSAVVSYPFVFRPSGD